ncbi:MAG: phospholipase C, phosphocholine-specific [Cytophagaceae bacterium SCN 52-12]|nr:MAG: phospholipase C, phosphocholine-specific [Cytophagaceae bacterium SCN 52-12]
MQNLDRRKFIKTAAKAGLANALWPALIKKALAVEASSKTGTIRDVRHIVILMQENRSFDHYFGTMRGVRGFGDRFPIPLESGERAFHQSDGKRIVPPYRANRNTSNAALISGTPHDFPDMQAAWNQGKYGFWPLFKTPYSMAYYTREEIPFQYALAESFTICDAYHCSVATGTDPNRIVFWSGSNFDPEKRASGINCTDQHSEPVNLRCWVDNKMPDPGYSYRGNAFTWDTIPDVLEKAGVSWRIYQDPNNNWSGAMHGCLAFESFRSARPGSPVYENGMKHWSLDSFTNDVKNNSLPEVCWVLPAKDDSEHPGAPSSPYRGADFTHRVLEALLTNTEVWSKTVFFLTFDENDGLFDHIPAPAVPSYNLDNTLAGKSTIDLAGMYFHNDKGTERFADPFVRGAVDEKGKPLKTRIYQDARDTISGPLRPWGMGPRVPMYIISPWSKGGWVNSEVADHTSVGQFIEKRFGVVLPAISPWHRAVSGDLTSAFNFANPNSPDFPAMPPTSDYQMLDEASKKLPKAAAPEQPSSLYQERGVRFSKALPYQLDVQLRDSDSERHVTLEFKNRGRAGAVFHVYDLYHLERIPKRYTVEAGKRLEDSWNTEKDDGRYDLEIFGPNGFFRKYKGGPEFAGLEAVLTCDAKKGGIALDLVNRSKESKDIEIKANAYGYKGSEEKLKAGGKLRKQWTLSESGNWYDFSVILRNGGLYRFAGRVETGKDSISDPAMGIS